MVGALGNINRYNTLANTGRGALPLREDLQKADVFEPQPNPVLSREDLQKANVFEPQLNPVVPVNEFMPNVNGTNLDRIKTGQQEIDSKSLFEQIGRSSDADKYLALALGGFSMAEAAGKPGATFLTSLGAGGKVGITAAATARSNAEKRDAAKALADAKLAAAKAKGTTFSTAYKDARDSLPPGTPDAAIRLEAKRLITARLPTDSDDKRTGKLGIAYDMFPENTTEAAAKRKQWLALSDLGQDKAARAIRMLEEVESSKAYQDRNDPEHSAALLAHKRHTSNLNAANSESRITTAESKVGLLERKLVLQREMPLRKAEVVQFTKMKEINNTLPMYHRSVSKMAATFNSGKVATGGLQRTFSSAKSMFDSFGIDIDPVLKSMGIKSGDLALSQYTEAQQIGLMSAILKGKTYGNNPSNKDVETILKSLPGLGISPEANARIIYELQREAEKRLEMNYNNVNDFEYAKGVNWQKSAQKRLANLIETRNKTFDKLEDQVFKTTSEYFKTLGIAAPTVDQMRNYEEVLKSQGGPQDRRYRIHKTYELLRSGGA